MTEGLPLNRVLLDALLQKEQVNRHAVEFLDHYCGMAHAPCYAVLIKGPWGSGKTHLVEKFLEAWKYADAGRRAFYVSLYGVTSFQQIEDELFRQAHPLLASKAANFAGRLLKGALKATIKVDLDHHGTLDVASAVPELDFLKNISVENTLLVFDDIERCSMNVSDVMGFINHYVEHEGARTLIIANENDIISREDERYGKIKEKLIGRTMEVVPSVDAALASFLGKINSEAAKSFLTSASDIIKGVYGQSGAGNLRFIRQSLWDFERLFGRLDRRYTDSRALMERVLKLFLAVTFEVQEGNVPAPEIPSLFEYDWNAILGKNIDPPPRQRQVAQKYPDIQFLTPLLSGETWRNIIDRGIIETAVIETQFSSSNYFRGETQAEWRTLWEMRSLTAVQFDAALASTVKKFEERSYSNVGEVLHVSAMFVYLAKEGLLSWPLVEVIQKAKSYLSHLCETGQADVSVNRALMDFSSHEGLGFYLSESFRVQRACRPFSECEQRSLRRVIPQNCGRLDDGDEGQSGRFLRGGVRHQ